MDINFEMSKTFEIVNCQIIQKITILYSQTKQNLNRTIFSKQNILYYYRFWKLQLYEYKLNRNKTKTNKGDNGVADKNINNFRGPTINNMY